jgi:hypothetical protein
MKRILSLLFLLVSFCAFAQNGTQPTDFADYTKRVAIIPPSPVAATLGTFGNSTADLVTGAIKASVSLFDFNVGSKSIPIALNYHSNGFRVDELQSMVGNGWTLMAGGMISRTIYGVADENATRILPPPNSGVNIRELRDFFQQTSVNSAFQNRDAQPDIFNFNFPEGSGSFMLDRALTPVLINHSNLHIEKNFDPTADWNFKISTIDGTQYYFGGNAATEFTKTAPTGCGVSHSDYQSTGWFLTKIIYRNGDEVNLEYNSVFLSNNYGVNESQYKWLKTLGTPCEDGIGGDPAIFSPNYTNIICQSIFLNSTKELTKITSNKFGTIEFSYSNRKDIATNTDLGDRILTQIKVSDPSGARIKLCNLSYTNVTCSLFGNSWVSMKDRNRSFLTKVEELAADNSVIKAHVFEYNNLTELPPRMSFAQDHYGFYNGANNQSLVPKPSALSTAARFPAATGNREVNPVYAVKGLLTKILYPTGGFEEFELEPNTEYSAKQIMPSLTSINAQGQGSNIGCNSFVQQFTAPFSQEASLRGQADVDPSNNDPIHSKATITLTDVSSSSLVYKISLKRGQTINEVVNLEGGHSYSLTVDACWLAQGAATVDYYASLPQTQYNNNTVGGIRVKSITSTFNYNEPTTKKYYSYTAVANPQQSSAKVSTNFQYEKLSQNRMVCPYGLFDMNTFFNVMYSSTFYNNAIYNGGFIQYEFITEIQGDLNHPVGVVEHKYTVAEDRAAAPLQGEDISGAPKSNYSIYSGMELEQNVYNNQMQLIKKTVNEYKDDLSAARTFKGYSVAQVVSLPISRLGVIPLDEEILSYNYSGYEILCRWIYKSKEKELNYVNGTAVMEKEIQFEYNSPVHCLPTKIVTYNSKGEKQIVNAKYSSDEVATQSLDLFQLSKKADEQFSLGEDELYTTITPVNAQINSYYGQAMGLLYNCRSQYIGNCFVCNSVLIPCNDVSCYILQDHKVQDCLNLTNYSSLNNSISLLLSNVAQYKNTYQLSIESVVTNFNNSIVTFNAELESLALATTDQNLKSLYMLRRKGIIELVEKSDLLMNMNGVGVLGTIVQNKFKQIANGDIVPDNVYLTTNGTGPVKQVSYNSYDASSNSIEYQAKDGIDVTIVWDNINKYPIAKVIASKKEQCAFTSFETIDKGNWQFSGVVVQGTQIKGITGNNYYDLNSGPITKTNIPQGNYIVSLWKRAGSTISVNGNSSPTVSGRTVDGWTYVEFAMNISNSIAITGAALIDELRLYPAGSQMSTFTYIPLVGVSTICDANNKINYYEYDSFNRLRRIKDQDGNVVKVFDYQYQANP